jgi:hypothetical protein
MANSVKIKTLLISLLLSSALFTYGETFVAHDDSFRIDDTTGWQEAAPMTIDGVLALEKDKTRVDIRRTECTDEQCLDQLINQDLAEIKSKNMAITPNALTGQEINRVEFASGEPFFYIHFSKGASRFSAGYFLINARVYSVLVKNAVYEQIDPLFAALSPLAQIPQAPADEQTAPESADPAAQPVQEEINVEERTYEIEGLPEVESDAGEEINLLPAVEPEQPASQSARKITLPKLKHYALRGTRLLKKAYTQGEITTLVSPRMPVYLRSLGHVFDIAVLFVLCFMVLLSVTAVLRVLIPARKFKEPVNPNSFYPIKLRRLYGTPAVFFRARDNQGNILVALASRWDGLFFFTGLILGACALLTLAAVSLVEQLNLLPLYQSTYLSFYSWGAVGLISAVLLALAGYAWAQLAQKEIILFDRKGKKAAAILKQGLWCEKYQIYFARSKDTLTAQRTGFWRRHYRLFNEKEMLLAEVKERSVFRAVLRKFTGHLWGLLRADYEISGATESRGSLQSARSAFARYTCTLDKPEAVQARDLLTLSLLIIIRDRDKWYPWIG